jgi:hypothetical protein
MRVLSWCRVTGFAAFLLVAGPALGQNCAGFTDVLQSNSFCANIEWLKNREITLGCTSATLYCPNASVTRAAMAAFMNRLAVALTPEDIQPVAYTSPGPLDLSTPPIQCQTADYQVLGYPRRATFNSKVNVWDPTSDVELVIDVMYSLGQGLPGTWVSVSNSQVYQTLRAGGTVPDDVTMYPIGFLDLDVGQQVRFGIRIARESGTGNPNVYCANRVTLTNRNGVNPPYDGPAGSRTGRAADRPPQ